MKKGIFFTIFISAALQASSISDQIHMPVTVRLNPSFSKPTSEPGYFICTTKELAFTFAINPAQPLVSELERELRDAKMLAEARTIFDDPIEDNDIILKPVYITCIKDKMSRKQAVSFIVHTKDYYTTVRGFHPLFLEVTVSRRRAG
jgi:hypothetical protein